MAALGSQSIASSYEQLLHVDADGGGNSTTHVSVKDGDNGTTFGFTIASDALMMSSTNRLEFGDTGTYIHQSADGVLDLVSDTELELNATTIDINGAVDISGATQLNSTLTVGANDTGYDVIFYGDTDSSNMHWDTSADELVINDGRLYINQDDNDNSIYIDSEATTGIAVFIDTPTTTQVPVLKIADCNSLTTGSVAQFHSNSDDGGTRNVVEIQNQHTSATGATALKVIQDAAQTALSIDQDGNGSSINIDSEATSSSVIMIQAAQNQTGQILNIDDADQLTTGGAIMVKSNSDDDSTRNLVKIINEHADADNTVLLYLDQDGADYVIEDSSGAKLTAAGVWTDASDVLRKKDVVDLPYGLSEVLQMEPKKYVYKHKDIDGIGFIAQEMEKIIPEIVTGEDAYLEDVLKHEAVEAQNAVLYEEGDKLPEGAEVGDVKIEAVQAAEAVIEKDTIMGGKSIAYGELTSIIVKAIQELSAKVTALEG